MNSSIMKEKKGVSPVVSTVLLIMIVIVIAIIIILWARGFVKEIIEKNIDGNIKRVNEYCNEVRLEPLINNDRSFGFDNVGNVPVYRFNLKVVETNSGNSEILNFYQSVNPGFGVILDSTFDPNIKTYDLYDEIVVIPVLLGKTEGGNKEFQCPEETGVKI